MAEPQIPTLYEWAGGIDRLRALFEADALTFAVVSAWVAVLGLVARALFVSDALGNANKFDGPEGIFSVGLHLRLGEYVRIVPRIDFTVGPSGDGNAHAIFIFGASLWLNLLQSGASRCNASEKRRQYLLTAKLLLLILV